jgi:uncharacterized protein DUF4115
VMPGEEHTPFNEQAALAELERLQRALAESRQRRKHATAAFDDFVGSFRREPADPVGRAARHVERRPLSADLDTPVAPAAQPAAPRKPFPKAGLLAGAVTAVAAGVVLTRAWRSAPPAPTSAPATTSTPSAVESPVSSPASTRDESTAAAGVQAELIAVRDVWVRATVDGERAVERELEAGARVPLRATRSIVIRAGDAGAVRLTIGGQDQGALGPKGQVVTRTFAVNSPTAR